MIEMQLGKRYVTTKGSDDCTFHTGDHISICDDGAIMCDEARGWIESELVKEATKGMEIELDKEYYDKLRDKLKKALDELDVEK
jgi:hypothetical protein